LPLSPKSLKGVVYTCTEETKFKNERVVRLFRIGRRQIVIMPPDLSIAGKKALARRAGRDVILSPLKSASDETWKSYFEMVARLRAEAPEEFEGFMEDRWPDRPKDRVIW
jgi:virulence-associated protein VagC